LVVLTGNFANPIRERKNTIDYFTNKYNFYSMTVEFICRSCNKRNIVTLDKSRMMKGKLKIVNCQYCNEQNSIFVGD